MNSRYALSKKLLFFCILCVIECAAAAKLAAERILWYDPLGNLSVMPPLWFVCTLFITAAFIDLLPIYVLHWVSITSSTAYWSSLSLASLPSWSTNIVMARCAFFFLPAGQLALLMKVFDCFVWWAFATAESGPSFTVVAVALTGASLCAPRPSGGRGGHWLCHWVCSLESRKWAVEDAYIYFVLLNSL